METAHCGEVTGESFPVSSLKLLDEELEAGGDDFFVRLRLGGRGKGVTLLASFVLASLLIGYILRFELPCCVCSRTRLGPSPRQRGLSGRIGALRTE
jgi:hypothetical protein